MRKLIDIKIPWWAWLPFTSAPFAIYFWLKGAGQLDAAIVAALLAALALNALRLARRQLKTLELALVSFFVLHLVATDVLQTALFTHFDAALLQGLLAGVAWVSLLRRQPFTLEYAHDDYARELWDNPLFVGTNMITTLVWALSLTLTGLLGLARALMPQAPSAITGLLPTAITILATVLTLLIPRWFPRWIIARQIKQQNPYPWPAPAFNMARRPDGRNQHDVVIVGSGLGGLSAGALLARRGLNVFVAEQHFEPGGYCTSWERGVRRGNQRLRYVFDAGVHDISGLGPRGPVRRLLTEVGAWDQLEFRHMGHEYILPDLHLKVPRDAGAYVAELQRLFRTEAAHLAAFFAEMKLLYTEMYADVDANGGFPGAPRTVDAMLAFPAAHPHMMRWMNQSFPAMLDTYFQDQRLKQLMASLTGYLSDNPLALSAMMMAPIFGYYFDGGYYPVGGSQSIANALVKVINDAGGEVRLRTPVRRILADGGRAAGIELASGEMHCAEAVISNADLRHTLLDLVGREHLPADYAAKADKLTPSTSAFMVFLGLDSTPDLSPFTSYVSGDSAAGGIGIVTPSLVDPSIAPQGHSAMTLIRLLPQAQASDWDRIASGYLQRKRAYGDRMIACAEELIPGLRQHIVYRQDATPATFQRYTGATSGSIYGFTNHSILGETVRTPIEHLYLAGSSVAGSGVEAVVIAGMRVAHDIGGH